MPRNIRVAVASPMMPRSRMRTTRATALTPNIFLISTNSTKLKSRRRRPTSRTSSCSGTRKALANRSQIPLGKLDQHGAVADEDLHGELVRCPHHDALDFTDPQIQQFGGFGF